MSTPRPTLADAPVRRRSRQASLWLLCLGASACANTEGVVPEEPVVEGARKVIGGEPSGVCGWPSTVHVEGGCTGTLIHPRVVTTAAHCLTGSRAEISFGEAGEPGGFAVTGECTAGANGSQGASSGSDWGYCVLPEDPRIDQVPITPPLVGCEAERFLKPGNRGWIVGYGTTGTGWFARGGQKREVEVPINQLNKQGPGTVDVGDANIGACHGDSGGPIYMELVDGDKSYGFRVFGSTSGPGESFCDCTCSTTYVNIEQHVRAIEENEGIDVTPCTADDGSWDPGPDCSNMLANPRDGSGTWPACEVARTTDPIATCGDPYMDPSEAPVDASTPDGGTTTLDAGSEVPDDSELGGGTAGGSDAGQLPGQAGTTGNPSTPPGSVSTDATGVTPVPWGTTGEVPNGFAMPDAGTPLAAGDPGAGYPVDGVETPYAPNDGGGCAAGGVSSTRPPLWLLLSALLYIPLARRRQQHAAR